MHGLHLTADLYGCACDAALLVDASRLGNHCREAIRAAGLTLVDERFFTFPPWQGQPGGVTGALLLAESHLAIHTWPERRGVTLDVYVCNFSTDNSSKAEQLMGDLVAAFRPAQQDAHRILRGMSRRSGHACTDTAADMAEDAAGQAHARGDAGELLLEWLNTDSAYGFRARRRLQAVQSPYQNIEVFDTPQFGRLFRLDGAYMTSERDEFFYHEPLVHPAAIAHAAPRTALVVGGGDGGSTEELLKHPSIEQVVVAELDAQVVQVAREHLGAVHRGAFDDPRVRLDIGDGFDYVRRCGQRFDLVLLDLTDPDTPARRLYTREFFEAARRSLSAGGALVLHLGSPVFSPARVQRLLADLHASFPVVRPMGLYIPLYGAYWGMAIASESLDPIAIDAAGVDARLAARGIGDLQYYNAQVHGALFALPNFYRALTRAA